jgi:DNA-binding response OmpR family regulator
MNLPITPAVHINLPSAPAILVVDDDSMLRYQLSRTLRAHGYRVLTASDGMEAESLIESEPSIRIVLSDINMPRRDGIGLSCWIREQHPELHTVLISGLRSNASMIRGYSAGAVYYITKPFKRDTVLNIVRYLIDDLSPQSARRLELTL